jgi:hypothetical protein
VVVVLLDAPANIRHSFEIVDEWTAKSGLVTSEFVPELWSQAGSGGAP